jgi:hypothetical protein
MKEAQSLIGRHEHDAELLAGRFYLPVQPLGAQPAGRHSGGITMLGPWPSSVTNGPIRCWPAVNRIRTERFASSVR